MSRSLKEAGNVQIYLVVRCLQYNSNMTNRLPNLLETHPHIAIEAFGWDPVKVIAESHEKIAWKCKNSHIWVEKIINRTENNSNCPKCLVRLFNG